MKPQTLTPDTLKALKTRLGLSDQGLADYLGVSVHAARKWLNGTRQPESSAARLVEVLGIIEALAPNVHAAMVPQRK
jgi:DNA-binding transcriptional regulator YiaG